MLQNTSVSGSFLWRNIKPVHCWRREKWRDNILLTTYSSCHWIGTDGKQGSRPLILHDFPLLCNRHDYMLPMRRCLVESGTSCTSGTSCFYRYPLTKVWIWLVQPWNGCLSQPWNGCLNQPWTHSTKLCVAVQDQITKILRIIFQNDKFWIFLGL